MMLKNKEIEKAIKAIKIPKYDDTKVKALIEKSLKEIDTLKGDTQKIITFEKELDTIKDKIPAKL
jgi:hypothetical protein